MSQNTTTLTLYVYNRGYQVGRHEFIGPCPPWPYVLTYRRGTTPRHGNKRAELNKVPTRGDGPVRLQAECRPSQLVEWWTLILPQNGFVAAPKEAK